MEFTIGKRKIGPGQPVFVIAEISGNHNQSIDRAKKIIDAAVTAGVDAVKLQTYTPDTMTIDSDKEYFKVKDSKLWAGKTLYELYSQAYTPWEWQPELKQYAEKQGLIFFSTPFDTTAVDFLEKMKVEVYKVASFEVVDIPLLKKIGQTKKPVIISRGMASLEETELALKTLRDSGARDIAILHCVSAYPAEPKNMNLATIPDIIERFGVVAGLSDHTLGTSVAVASIGLGARIIEKHGTLSRTDGGPDAAFSLEPDELTHLVEQIRIAEAAIGRPHWGSDLSEASNHSLRRSIFAVADIKKGEELTRVNIRVIRPGHGVAPRYYDTIIGKKAAINIERGEPLSLDMIV